MPRPPGGHHLSDAIRRLSLRRHNFLCERKFFQAERQRKAEALGGGAGLEDGEGGASGRCSPAGSGRSSCSNLSELSAASGVFKSFLPERLQIVKPMEGEWRRGGGGGGGGIPKPVAGSGDRGPPGGPGGSGGPPGTMVACL